MLRAVVVREKVVRLVSILTDRSIKVTQQGAQAFVRYDNKTGEPVLVNIPYIPDDASDEYLDAIEGFLDHEVGHVLFSDSGVLIETQSKHGKQVAMLLNIIEDPFVERKMAERFPGSAHNLTNVGRFFLKHFTDKKLAEKDAEPLSLLIVPAIRALSGQKVFQDYMDAGNKWLMIKPFMDKLGEYLKKELPTVSSTADGQRIALEIQRRLSEKGEESEGEESEGGKSSSKKKSGSKSKKAPKEEPASGEEPEEGKKPEGEEPEEGGGGTGESESDEEEGGADADEEEGGAETEEGEGEPSSASEEEGDEEEEGASGPGETSDEEGTPSGCAPEGEESASGGKDKDSTKPLEWGELASSIEKDFDEGLSEALSEISTKEAKEAAYLPFTKDKDTVSLLEVPDHGSIEHEVKRMIDRVDHMVAPLQKDLERAVAARSASVWSAGHRTGRLNGSSLARLTAFKDDRAFRRRHDNKSRAVAVSLLLDCSGSMSGSKIMNAAYTAYALSAVLDRMNITHEALGFTTRGSDAGSANADRSRTGIKYSRVEPLYMPIFKEFHERMTNTVRSRFASLANAHWLANNVDGECVQIAATRLQCRSEARKILIVLSDGAPAFATMNESRITAYEHLKGVIAEAERDGVEVLGIGIESHEVRKFYKKNVVLNDVRDLPASVIGEVKRLLTQF